MLTSFSGCTDFNWAVWCLSFNPEIHKKKNQLIDRQSKITGELSLPARFPPGVSYAPCQQHAPYVTLDPLNLTLPMNLKVEVTVRGDLTRPWHCQQGRIDKGRQGTGFVLLFRCEKVTQTRNVVQRSAAWWDSCLRSVNNAETRHWKQPPGESQHCQLCQTQSDERKEQNYTVLWENEEKKKWSRVTAHWPLRQTQLSEESRKQSWKTVRKQWKMSKVECEILTALLL